MKFILLAISALLLLTAVFAQGVVDTSANVCPNGYIRKDISVSNNIIIDSSFAAQYGFSNHVNKELRAVLTIFYKTDGLQQTSDGVYQFWKGSYFFRLFKEGTLVFIKGGDVQGDGVIITFDSLRTNQVACKIYHGNTRIYTIWKSVSVSLSGSYPLTAAFWAGLTGDVQQQFIVDGVQMIGTLKTFATIESRTCNPKASTTLCPRQGCDCLCNAAGDCSGNDMSADLVGGYPTFTFIPSWCPCRGGAPSSSESVSSSIPVPSEIEESSSNEYPPKDKRAKSEEPAPPPIVVTPPQEAYTCPYIRIELTQICEYVNATYCKKSVTSFSALTVSSANGVYTISGRAALNDNKGIGAVSAFFALSITQSATDNSIAISFQLNQVGNNWQWVPYQQDRLVFTFRVTGAANLVLAASGASCQYNFAVSGQAQVPNEKHILESHDASADFTISFPQLQNVKGSSAPVTCSSVGTSDSVLINIGFTRDSFTKENLLAYGPVSGRLHWTDGANAGNNGSSNEVPSTSVPTSTGSDSAATPSTGTVDPNARETGSPASTVNSWLKMEL